MSFFQSKKSEDGRTSSGSILISYCARSCARIKRFTAQFFISESNCPIHSMAFEHASGRNLRLCFAMFSSSWHPMPNIHSNRVLDMSIGWSLSYSTAKNFTTLAAIRPFAQSVISFSVCPFSCSANLRNREFRFAITKSNARSIQSGAFKRRESITGSHSTVR